MVVVRGAHKRVLLSFLRFALHTVRVCAAFLLRFCLAVLLEPTELAKPAETPRLCCRTQVVAHGAGQLQVCQHVAHSLLDISTHCSVLVERV